MKKENIFMFIDTENKDKRHNTFNDYERPYLEIPVYPDNYRSIEKEEKKVKENKRVIIIDLNL